MPRLPQLCRNSADANPLHTHTAANCFFKNAGTLAALS